MEFRIPLDFKKLEELEGMLETIPLTVLISILSKFFEVETKFYLEVSIVERINNG